MIKGNIWKQIIEYSKRIARAAILYYYIRTYVCEVSFLDGPSMEPTLKGDSVVLVNKISLLFRKIRKNEVVALRSPIDRSVSLCKRVTGIEGDIIKVNKEKTIPIPSDCLWVEGDNKHNSFDSRLFGPIKREMVSGSVILQLYPKLTLINKTIVNENNYKV